MDKKKTLVSVILPVYNTSKYLKRCLDSIIKQTYTNLEIIIINDGSTDNSLNICNKYSKNDHRIKIFSQKNKGAYIARNEGLSLATGDWLIFVDSDDWIDIDGIEGLVAMINKYPQIDMIRSYNRQVSEEISFHHNNIEPSGRLYLMEELLLNNKVGGFMSSMFLKRSIVNEKNLKFSTEHKTKMDLVFTFEYVLNCKWILVYDKVFYNYYVRENSLSRSFSYEKSIVHLKASELVYNYSKKYKNQIIKDYVKKSLNNGLASFYLSIIGLLNNDEIKISNKEIKHTIKEYLRKNNLRFYSLNFKNKIFTIISYFDYRILKYLFYARYLKKVFK